MGLVERGAALGALEEFAEEARRGEGRLVLVGGEAGVGKSALVERFRERVGDARWSWGMCDGVFARRTLGPLFDISAQLGGRLLEECRDGASREELFRGLLCEVGGRDRLDVVVVEDVHWADEGTLDLLGFLGRRLRGAALLVIATYRDEGTEGDFRIALGELAALRSTRRIGVQPLSADGVRLLAGCGDTKAEALHRLTGGNPFYVTEVVRSGMSEVPGSARDVVLARAACLGDAAREVLDVVALGGVRVDYPVADAVGLTKVSAVDEAVASGLLSGDGEGLRFRHEIARLAVQGAVAPHHARTIHARLLTALTSLGCDDDPRLAFHAEAAGDREAVLRHATAAARQAARLAAHREAATEFRRALRYADSADPATRAGLHEDLAEELALLDQWQDAAEESERALADWRAAGDVRKEGDALRRLSRIRWNMCHGEVTTLEAAVAILEPLGPGVELAWAYATFANQLMLLYEFEAAEGLARRAEDLAGPLGATDVLSSALNTAAVCAESQDREWEAGMGRALRLAVDGGHHDQAGRAFTNTVSLLSGRRRFADAERHVREGLAYCVEHDITTYVTCLRGEQATVLERTGRWEESLTISAGILATVDRSPSNRLCTLRRIGSVLSRRGEPDVWRHLDEAVELAERAGEPQQIVSVRLTRAEAFWLENRVEEARREAELAHKAVESSGPWERGASALWLRRTGSGRGPRAGIAEPYGRELDGDLTGAARAWQALGCRYDAALALSGAPGETELRDALKILNALGAVPAARIVRRKLRERGVRSLPAGPRPATREHPSGLTLREREVLTLLRARRTNAEIAAQLFISVKTAGHHVSAILTKLGVPSRQAAAAEAARLGLGDP
ncbi:helix-turn-helix transcriptional regulator [Planotetraspora sp. A-T 1434]|uniref:helix-turn-helix transcriptional regulator n=1 Tax=Planotetraspora sp. A-T 1434 TaxID=2979219 RepID=UPI0028FC0BFE|nr:AAA family ATPase [Planotetraspora sp. A-T 1434]